MPALVVENLTVRFGGLVALSHVSMTVKEGEIHGLIGPNGAGKSTLFNVLSRLVDPVGGTVSFQGRDLLRVPAHEVIRLGIARTFQNLLLCPRLSVLDNVLIGLHRDIRAPFWASALGLPLARRQEAEARAKAREMLQLVGLDGAATKRVSDLPYGAQKRLELARALVSQPRLLLLDEPAAGLTDSERRNMANLVRRLRDELGMTVIVVEHDLGLVMDLCESVTVLDFGRVIARGAPHEVRNNPDVIAAYIGGEMVHGEETPDRPEAKTGG